MAAESDQALHVIVKLDPRLCILAEHQLQEELVELK
jgi:hypothetical protein